MPSSSRIRRRRTALLILDMISCFEFPDGKRLVPPALRAARHIAHLKRRARRARWPVIYVNDTGSVWESDQREFLRRCAAPQAPGRKIAALIAPEADDYFMFKPRHSAFFDTSLSSLLDRLEIERLILTGTTSHQCVLFTAMDAHVRGYQLAVAPNCIASPRIAQTRHALAILDDALQVELIATRPL